MCVYVCISGTEYTNKTKNPSSEGGRKRNKVGRHVGYYGEQMRSNLNWVKHFGENTRIGYGQNPVKFIEISISSKSQDRHKNKMKNKDCVKGEYDSIMQEA